jgi:hypothetical protein
VTRWIRKNNECLSTGAGCGQMIFEISFLFKNENENQQLSCISHGKPFLWYVFHMCIFVDLGLGCVQDLLVESYVQKDASHLFL